MIRYFGAHGEVFPDDINDETAYFTMKDGGEHLTLKIPKAFHDGEELERAAIIRGHKIDNYIYCSVGGGFFYSCKL